MRHRKKNGPGFYSSGRPWRVYSCYNQCLQLGCAPGSGVFLQPRLLWKLGVGEGRGAGVPGCCEQQGTEAALLEENGREPSTVPADSTEITKGRFVCLLWGILHARTQTRHTLSGRSQWVDGRSVVTLTRPAEPAPPAEAHGSDRTPNFWDNWTTNATLFFATAPNNPENPHR